MEDLEVSGVLIVFSYSTQVETEVAVTCSIIGYGRKEEEEEE